MQYHNEVKRAISNAVEPVLISTITEASGRATNKIVAEKAWENSVLRKLHQLKVRKNYMRGLM